MAYINLIGRLTRDAKERKVNVSYSENPVSVIDFRVAENVPTGKKDESGKTIYKTRFYDVALWRKPGALQYLKQGRKLQISCEDTWETTAGERNGEIVAVTKITNPKIKYVDSKPSDEPGLATDPEEVVASEAPADIAEDELPFN